MMKKSLFTYCVLVAIGLMMVVPMTAVAEEGSEDDHYSAYLEMQEEAEEMELPCEMTFEEYEIAYEESGFDTTDEYADAYLGITEPQSSSSSSNKWYYNIGTSLPSGIEPDYSQYNLYDTVKKGDIIFEAAGGRGVTGHIAIVEGKYYSPKTTIKYIRIIEVIDVGVVRSCLDDERVNDKNVSLLRVTSATSDNINGAISFCLTQLGKKYMLDFGKDYDKDQADWYCSELVWAAYYNQGIDIEVSGGGEPGITPRDIRDSSKTKTISFK